MPTFGIPKHAGTLARTATVGLGCERGPCCLPLQVCAHHQHRLPHALRSGAILVSAAPKRPPYAPRGSELQRSSRLPAGRISNPGSQPQFKTRLTAAGLATTPMPWLAPPPCRMYNDAQLRKWEPRDKVLPVLSLLPLLGPAIYLCLRPKAQQ